MRVGYASPYVPPELIVAAGHQPRRLRAATVVGTGCAGCGAGTCAVAAGTMAAARNLGGAFVAASGCDQQRRAGHALEGEPGLKVCALHVPASASGAAVAFFRAELERLQGWLAALPGGHFPTPAELVAAARAAAEEREAVRSTYATEGVRAGAARLAALLGWPAPPVGTQPRADAVPLALVGSPLGEARDDFFAAVEVVGGRLVLDGSEDGERGLPAAPDLRALADDPLGELVACYLGGIPDAFRRPDEALHRWLAEGCRERGARGVILRHDPWCDLWAAEAQRLRASGGLPLLILSALEGDGEQARTLTRLGAFVEMLPGARGAKPPGTTAHSPATPRMEPLVPAEPGCESA